MSLKYDDFTGEVQHRIGSGEQAEAVRTSRAVLETLGERVDEGGATDIASPLPMEIDRYLLHVDHGYAYEYDEFVDRVLDRMNYTDLDLEASYGRPVSVEREEAVYRTKAVIAFLSEIVPGGEIANVEDQLPEEFGELFEFVDVETPPWEQDRE